MPYLNFNEWSAINEQKQQTYTIIDIWRGYDKIKFGDRQFGENSAIAQVQKKIIEKLNANPKTKKWVIDNNYKPDNDFGDLTARALGLALTGKEFKNTKGVEIGPNSLKKLGFDSPPNYSTPIKILATTLTIEAGVDGTTNEILAIANVILNRKFAKNKYSKNTLKSDKRYNALDIVLEEGQFSLWNGYGNIDREEKVNRAMKQWRPENYKNWKYAVSIANKMLNGVKISDTTKGSTHYYNPKIVKPVWGAGSKKWVSTNLGLIHNFGRDTSVVWAKDPIKRTTI